jgi:2-polyprenyl-6-methoxyphenol hydroxylase-like FAD-dependent oxidoreductase
MNDEQRLQIRFGPYSAPKFNYGDIVQCEVRGEVVIVGMTDSLIPWPLGRPKGMKGRASLVVCDGLAEAVRREANFVVQHWWGVCHSAVWKWRRVLDVPVTNEGTSQLRSEHTQDDWAIEARRKAHAKAQDPARCEKIAAARRGKKRPAHVIEALRKANTGRKLGESHRQKLREVHKKLGTPGQSHVGIVIWPDDCISC